MMVVCVSFPTYVYLIGTPEEFRAYAFKASSVSFVHWMFCFIYLKLKIQVKYLFKDQIYCDNNDLMISINRENLVLNIANVVNIAICLGIMIYGLVGNSFKAEDVSYQIQTALCLTYLGIWSSALCSLFKNFKGSKLLLPKKKIFINHAILLSVYLLASILYNLAELIP